MAEWLQCGRSGGRGDAEGEGEMRRVGEGDTGGGGEMWEGKWGENVGGEVGGICGGGDAGRIWGGDAGGICGGEGRCRGCRGGGGVGETGREVGGKCAPKMRWVWTGRAYVASRGPAVRAKKSRRGKY